MNIQEKISLIFELAVKNIVDITGSHSGDLSDEDKKKLRIQFDAELSWQTGDINCGQLAELIEKHEIE